MAAKDTLFQSAEAESDFSFKSDIVEVFDDMINRSVPLYDDAQNLVVRLTKAFYTAETLIYDIGCSHAETAIRLAPNLPDGSQIIGIDASPAMVAAARDRVAASGLDGRIQIRQGSAVDELPAETASVTIMSLTLQFIRPLEREQVLKNVMGSLRPGGALLLFEKTVSATPRINRIFIEKYHDYKSEMGYTSDEIWRKRLSLENVLIPYTIMENIDLLRKVGFSEAQTAFQWMNFAMFLAVK